MPVRRSWRSGRTGSQQFRASRRLASELAHGADLSPVDLVLEFGAGDGRLTAELAARARHVVAIEVDECLAARLQARFHGDRAVTVVHGDALRTPLPGSAFKVVSNPPFYLTAALLHRLLDNPRLSLLRADMVLGWGAALSLTAVHPPSRRSLIWQPWYELLLIRRLDPSTFQPPPATDAAVVSIRRRASPLLPAGEASAFRRWVRHLGAGFDVWQLVEQYRGRR